MCELYLRNLRLCVVFTLAIKNCFTSRWIVKDQTNRTLALLGGKRLIRENVDVLFRESLAEPTKRSGPVF